MRPFEKKLLVLRQQLIGARYFNALSALDFAMGYHTGTRAARRAKARARYNAAAKSE